MGLGEGKLYGRKECRIGKLCRKEATRLIQEATTGEARLLRSVLLREAERGPSHSAKRQRNLRPHQTGKTRTRSFVNHHLSTIRLSVEKSYPDSQPLGHMTTTVSYWYYSVMQKASDYSWTVKKTSW